MSGNSRGWRTGRVAALTWFDLGCLGLQRASGERRGKETNSLNAFDLQRLAHIIAPVFHGFWTRGKSMVVLMRAE